MSDADWKRLKRRFKLPDIKEGIDIRALLEHEIAHARTSMSEEQGRAPLRAKLQQLQSISKAGIGSPVPTGLHADVTGLLAGMAWRDRRFGRGDLTMVERCRQHVAAQKTVTQQLKDWANWCIMLGVGQRSHDRNHGGGHSFASQVFISVLLNFWTGVLQREAKSWASDANADSMAALTRFITECMQLAGVQGRTAPASKKIKFGVKRSEAGKSRTLRPADVHQRILRVRMEINAAVAAGLSPNLLSRMLNR